MTIEEIIKDREAQDLADREQLDLLRTTKVGYMTDRGIFCNLCSWKLPMMLPLECMQNLLDRHLITNHNTRLQYRVSEGLGSLSRDMKDIS